MKDNYSTRFDADAIMKEFGGVNGVLEALADVDCIVARKTAQKWRERNSIPANALAGLMLYKLRGGERIDLNDYLLEAC